MSHLENPGLCSSAFRIETQEVKVDSGASNDIQVKLSATVQVKERPVKRAGETRYWS